MILFYIFALILIAFLSFSLLQRHTEKKLWNNGKCPNCGYRWRYFRKTPNGSREYTCDKCGNHLVVSHQIDYIDYEK